MTLDEYLPTYKKVFSSVIAPMAPFKDFAEGPSECVIDYMGLPRCIKKLKAKKDFVPFVSVAFADALTNSGLNHSGKKESVMSLFKRDVLVLNTYNWQESSANISHRHPQVILGMHYDWSPEDLECLRSLFQEYLKMNAPLLPEGFFERLRQDPDIQVTCEYRSAMGIVLSQDVVGVYLSVMGGALKNATDELLKN